MPQIANTPDFAVVTLKIDGEFGGWTEKYNLLPSYDLTAALPVAGLIATKRSRLLARRHTILDTVISMKAVRNDSRNPASYVASPVLIGAEMTDPEETNETGSGLLFTFLTGDGKRTNRLIRGVRDSWITRNRNTLAAPTAYGIGGPYLTYVAPATAVDLLGDFLAYVRDNTVLINGPTGGPPVWTPYTYTEYLYRRVAKHDMGKRIGVSRGRQSTMA